MGLNMLDMKESNARTVLWQLRSSKTATKKDLAQLTGLSFATVGTFLNGFVESGEVLHAEMLSDTGGRPSQVYSFNAEYAHVLALSARVRNGENLVTAYVGNLYGEVVWQLEQAFDSVELTSFEIMIAKALQAYPTLRVLSFSLPGVEHDGKILINDYPKLVGISFTDHLRDKYQMPVVIANDVNAAVLGYAQSKDAVSVLVGIYFPKTFYPGAGIMIDSQILEGSRGFAGEVALLPLDIDWPSLNYTEHEAVGAAISKLIAVFCGIINPNHVVLYGDFFSGSLKETIEQKMSTPSLKNIAPSIVYRSDLDSDIISGLFARAIATILS